MSALDEPNGTVRYTAKELFAKIDAKLDAIVEGLGKKADHEALVALEARVDVLEKKEDERAGASWALRAIVALLFAIAGLLVPIVLHVM